ncbi:sigma-70 family RNA polymerase sigma factor [Streptomyces sp. HPF1205]|uniref:RNA polymerase sigma factor n=1 Tax=Streptomyces sp. HPF1205 TaxID=2873262 RepID=UPI0027E15D83|nr:sigma-70 family RNA polymerase sigma factor [Streptomyces sp. HPF1205]
MQTSHTSQTSQTLHPPRTPRTPRTSSDRRSPGTPSAGSRPPGAPAAGRGDAFAAAYPALRPLLAAEAAAHAPPGSGIDPADLEQAVWLRLLELGGARPAEPARWVAGAVRAEARAARALSGVRPYDDDTGPAGPPGSATADLVVAADQRRTVAAAVRALPGRCPQVVAALMSGSDPTYQEISRELGISQGSLGPLRSRCLGCLRAALKSRVGPLAQRGKAR